MTITHVISLQNSNLNTRLEARCRAIGLAYVSLQPLKIEFLPWQHPESSINTQDWLIFLSPNAVTGFFKEITQPFTLLPRLIAIGSGTTAVLANHTTRPILSPTIASSEGILELEPLQTIAQQTITLIKGIGGRELLKPALTARGAIVTELSCYRRVGQAVDLAQILKIWQNGLQPLLIATSCNALTAVTAQLPEALLAWLLQKKLVVSSERLYNHAICLGFTHIERIAQVSETELFTAIKEHS